MAFCTNSAIFISSQATDAAVGNPARTSFASVGPDRIANFCSGSTSFITCDILIKDGTSIPFEAFTNICSDFTPASLSFSQTSRVPEVAITDKIISAPEIASFRFDEISTFLSNCTSRGFEVCLFILKSSEMSFSLPQTVISSKLLVKSQAKVNPQHPAPSTVNFIFSPLYCLIIF